MEQIFKKNDKIGRYIVDESINKGGMAWVVKVHIRVGRYYALKVSRLGISKEQDEFNRTAIRDEAKLLSELDHSRIIKIFPIRRKDEDKVREDVYYARIGDLWYFCMEHLAGESLSRYLRNCGPLSVEEAANIVGNIVLGLYYLHSKNIVHLDVKAENVVFRTPVKKGEVFDPVLIDFGTAAGISKFSDEAGSPYVMSPERLRAARGMAAPETNRLIDPQKTEVWSIGVLLYQALTSQYPFPANNMRRLTSQIINDQPDPIIKRNPAVPVELEKFVIEGCLNKNPDLRPAVKEIFHFLKPYGSGPVLARKSSN